MPSCSPQLVETGQLPLAKGQALHRVTDHDPRTWPAGRCNRTTPGALEGRGSSARRDAAEPPTGVLLRRRRRAILAGGDARHADRSDASG